MSVTAGSSVWTGDSHQPMRNKLVLGRLLKSGGSGSVYLIPESPLQVAKIYHDRSDSKENERKVAAMLELSPQLPDIVDGGRRYVQIAWPQALLRDERSRFVGFLMPAVDVQATSELECILQERQARAAKLPTGLGAKITLAANLAVVIAALHAQHHHVIDLKPVNLRFYTQSLYMAMLDCDGFSIQGRNERFAADQMTPDYLAPEFQGKPLSAVGEEQQDLFALAVVIFQLLNFGIHPFTGRPNSDQVPTDIPGRISHRCYAYGISANPSLGPSPVSGHRAMPSDLRLLFDRAFANAGAMRPSAGEWVAVLKTYALRSSNRLTVCTANKEHQHFAGFACAACARLALIATTAKDIVAARVAASSSNSTARTVPPPAPRPTPSMRPPRQIVPATAQRAQGPVPIPALLLHKVRPQSPATYLKLLAAVGWIVLVILLQTCGQLQTRLQVANPTRPVATTTPAPASKPETAQPPPAVERGQGSLPDLTQNDIEVAAASVISGDQTARESAMSNLRGVAAKHPQSPGGVYQQEFARFSSGLSKVDPAARLRLTLDLEAALRQDRYDSEAAVDLGWVDLAAGDRSSARAWFVRAIAGNPNQAAAWYGFGVATTSDAEVVGALAIAETLNRDVSAAQAVRDRFPPQLLSDAGIKPERFAILEARARRYAVETVGGILPVEVAALADKPLPSQ
jgi:hypothetical protein